MGMLPKCGTGTGQTKFYFNYALQTCSPYTSNGCDSSLNSFKTIAECEDFCLSAGCKAGDAVYKDPNTKQPFLCNTALQNNCPLNYQCTLNPLTQEHVCCGSDSMGVCPAGEKAFIEPLTSTPRQCAMVADGKCPPGYLCRFSPSNHKYYCCGSVSGSLCPTGRALFRNPTSQLPTQCAIAPGAGGCPPSYTCQSDVPNAFQGYCCSQTLICPGGVDFHLDEKTQMPTTCTSEGFGFCPQGYTCQQQPETINFYCCAGKDNEAITDGCPPSQFAYIADGQIKGCDPFNADASTCPSEYSCQWSITNQKYQCCGLRPIRQTKPNKIDDGCPRKQFALLDRVTSKPRLCTAGEENSCPTGFFCQFSAKNGQFQCCGQSGGCPSRRAAFIAIDGNAQECIPGPDMCADGYECVRSAYGGAKNICCSKEENECRENEKLIDGRCVVLAKIDEPCNHDDECYGGSKCTDRICK
ncbi:Kunitz/Bovine pancreatic trypsin inhibitor domain protein [Oesophagostomum dentatum]|uniref:Kunitz/Bovine pancreatic trypsin inhibitor domain protein n=1 Tax=Oesophagostomum dentatum TaxID=61180 RepID=A0A0B1T4E1_OESDE|nr:Kunitz/Bovine pancreatic trypsin inhibitor domain protein [Oesophagostomum dentatum]